MASGTVTPCPSSTVQISFTRSPFTSGPAMRGAERGPVRPIWKYGPTVCEASGTRSSFFFLLFAFKGSRLGSTEHNIKFESKGPIGLRQVDLEFRDQALARLLVRNG